MSMSRIKICFKSFQPNTFFPPQNHRHPKTLIFLAFCAYLFRSWNYQSLQKTSPIPSFILPFPLSSMEANSSDSVDPTGSSTDKNHSHGHFHSPPQSSHHGLDLDPTFLILIVIPIVLIVLLIAILVLAAVLRRSKSKKCSSIPVSNTDRACNNLFAHTAISITESPGN